MSAQEFECRIDALVHAEPFAPFVFELEEGESIVIENPHRLAFGHGGASYLGSDEIRLIDCETVRSIRLAMQPV